MKAYKVYYSTQNVPQGNDSGLATLKTEEGKLC